MILKGRYETTRTAAVNSPLRQSLIRLSKSSFLKRRNFQHSSGENDATHSLLAEDDSSIYVRRKIKIAGKANYVISGDFVCPFTSFFVCFLELFPKSQDFENPAIFVRF